MRISTPTQTIENVVNKILPTFGSKGLDVPTFDRDKHKYLVDQFQFDSGNRTLTYAAISDSIIVEVVFGHYHGWEYMNKLRILTSDGAKIKVIATKEWPQSTRANVGEIRSTVADRLSEYISSNPAAKGINKDSIRKEAEKMAVRLFSKTEDYLDTPLGRQVLLTYCENCNYCQDLAKFL